MWRPATNGLELSTITPQEGTFGRRSGGRRRSLLDQISDHSHSHGVEVYVEYYLDGSFAFRPDANCQHVTVKASDLAANVPHRSDLILGNNTYRGTLAGIMYPHSECCTPFLTAFGEVSEVMLNTQRESSTQTTISTRAEQHTDEPSLDDHAAAPVQCRDSEETDESDEKTGPRRAFRLR